MQKQGQVIDPDHDVVEQEWFRHAEFLLYPILKVDVYYRS